MKLILGTEENDTTFPPHSLTGMDHEMVLAVISNTCCRCRIRKTAG
jgi:hypothetical protein